MCRLPQRSAPRIAGSFVPNKTSSGPATRATRPESQHRLDATEKAQTVAGHAPPEIAFNLRAIYAALEPPQMEKALWLLTSTEK